MYSRSRCSDATDKRLPLIVRGLDGSSSVSELSRPCASSFRDNISSSLAVDVTLDGALVDVPSVELYVGPLAGGAEAGAFGSALDIPTRARARLLLQGRLDRDSQLRGERQAVPTKRPTATAPPGGSAPPVSQLGPPAKRAPDQPR